MLVQGPISILISNFHHLTKEYYNFLSPFLTFFKEKSTFLRILIITKWSSFDHHFPPSLFISKHSNFLSTYNEDNFIFVVVKIAHSGFELRTFTLESGGRRSIQLAQFIALTLQYVPFHFIALSIPFHYIFI